MLFTCFEVDEVVTGGRSSNVPSKQCHEDPFAYGHFELFREVFAAQLKKSSFSKTGKIPQTSKPLTGFSVVAVDNTPS